MVWAGVVSTGRCGPFFIEGTLDGASYLRLLNERVIPALQAVQNPDEPLIFQQDGAPPHYARQVRNRLDEAFSEWIGRRGSIEWPPRSTDMTVADFFLWGYLKDKVYARHPTSLEELKKFIREEFHTIPQEMLARACASVKHRLEMCCFLEGQQLKLHKEYA